MGMGVKYIINFASKKSHKQIMTKPYMRCKLQQPYSDNDHSTHSINHYLSFSGFGFDSPFSVRKGILKCVPLFSNVPTAALPPWGARTPDLGKPLLNGPCWIVGWLICVDVMLFWMASVWLWLPESFLASDEHCVSVGWKPSYKAIVTCILWNLR